MEAAETNATVQGASHANLRAGPGLNHPPKTILKEGDLVTVQGQEGNWYLVTAPDGQKGYVHSTVVKLAGENKVSAVATELTPAKTAVTESKEPNKPATTDTPATTQPLPTTTPAAPPIEASNPTQQSPTQPPPSRPASSVTKAEDRKAPASKSPSLIQLLEGREADMILWAAIAVSFFLIGWICGGNYYLRRDRVKRTRLRF